LSVANISGVAKNPADSDAGNNALHTLFPISQNFAFHNHNFAFLRFQIFVSPLHSVVDSVSMGLYCIHGMTSSKIIHQTEWKYELLVAIVQTAAMGGIYPANPVQPGSGRVVAPKAHLKIARGFSCG
jgi:hypothetical protein